MIEMCQTIRDAIALEGRAPSSEAATRHLNECAHCQSFLESVLAVEQALDGLAGEDASDDVVEAAISEAAAEIVDQAGSLL